MINDSYFLSKLLTKFTSAHWSLKQEDEEREKEKELLLSVTLYLVISITACLFYFFENKIIKTFLSSISSLASVLSVFQMNDLLYIHFCHMPLWRCVCIYSLKYTLLDLYDFTFTYSGLNMWQWVTNSCVLPY